METITNSTVEVFKTNVQNPAAAAMLVALLQKRIINSHVNFDLDDCDKVLRIEGTDVSHQLVIELLKKHGYLCELLND
ncbi:hypothetical protein [Mucilaginibacter endophyticus]|uniref:hypothetical protein n=1 Tax=Mucilaginibacter endophyticus TaxID=2675003 RepID=UPI000E0D946E|nr:hypothetical protein [Mucilaginibacter endophyticus]